MTVLEENVRDLKREVAELQRRLAERDSELSEMQRRLAERDSALAEAVAQQAASSEVLQIINSSPGDLAPVFDAMLEKAVRLCDAAHGELHTYDGERFHTVAFFGVSAEYAQLRAKTPPSGRPGTGTGRLLETKRTLHVLDAAAGESYIRGEPSSRLVVDVAGVRTSLSVPLLKDDRVLGNFLIYRKEVRPFTEKQIALVENFAAQAVIAMENARLITETREALEQQTATAEVLQVINSSPGDLAPVFDAMLEKATRLCGADTGHLLRYENGDFSCVASYEVPEGFDRLVPLNTPLGDLNTKASLPFRMLAGLSVVHVTDLRQDESYRSGAPAELAAVEAGIRSVIAVPLLREGEVVGGFMMHRREVRPYTDKQIALLQNFAAQAVIATENARLITETREALEHQTATAEVLGVINSSPGDLTPVFDAMLEKAIRLCGGVRGVLWNIEGERGSVAASRGLSDEFIGLLREHGKRGTNATLQRVIRGEHLFQFNVSEHELDRSDDPLAVAAFTAGVRTLIWVALIREGVAVGAFAVGRSEVRPFSEKETALLQHFAAQAVIAMENARLITETREALEQQTATAEVLGVINASPGNLAPVFDAILEKAHLLCGAPQGGMFLREGELFRAVATRGMPERFAERLREGIGPDAPVPSPLVAGERFVHIQDMAEIDHPTARMAVEVGAARSLLAVPLRKDNALFGMIVAGRRELRPFTDKQIALLQNFAAQAVIAMENARLLGELRQRTDEVAELNRGLEARVAEQVEELGRVGRLKRFLAPQLAELIVSQGDEKILESHRREIVVVFCDLRGYTAFTETAEPEEVLDFLREYHGALGPLVSQFEGTLDQFSGDGIMVFLTILCPYLIRQNAPSRWRLQCDRRPTD
jgi:GAF domain-containing protein